MPCQAHFISSVCLLAAINSQDASEILAGAAESGSLTSLDLSQASGPGLGARAWTDASTLLSFSTQWAAMRS